VFLASGLARTDDRGHTRTVDRPQGGLSVSPLPEGFSFLGVFVLRCMAKRAGKISFQYESYWNQKLRAGLRLLKQGLCQGQGRAVEEVIGHGKARLAGCGEPFLAILSPCCPYRRSLFRSLTKFCDVCVTWEEPWAIFDSFSLGTASSIYRRFLKYY
jgi:hypothetical protein